MASAGFSESALYAVAAVLLVFGAGLTYSGVDYAEASSPVAPPRDDPGTVWTVMNRVSASVCGNYAVVRVIADIGNRGPDPEFPFRVTLPDDAFITGLTITRDGEVFEARIEERQAARAEYEDTKAREATGGLVEKERHSSTYQFLVNTAAFDSVVAELTYEQYLPAHQGVHTLALEAPVSGFGEDLGASFDVQVCRGDRATAMWTDPATNEAHAHDDYVASYHVGPRRNGEPTPFNVHYTLPASKDGGDITTAVTGGEAWFAHRFRAPPDAVTLPLGLVLVLDVSGSMRGAKLVQMQDAAAQMVHLLDDEDRLHLVLFSSGANAAWPGLEPATQERRRTAEARIHEAFAGGGTNIEAGLRRGFGAYGEQAHSLDAVIKDAASAPGERLPLLVFLTDGQATAGATDRDGLRAVAREANDNEVSVFALAFGADADWAIVDGLARDGGGTAIRVPEGAGAEVDLTRFMTALTTPVLRNVGVNHATRGVTAFATSAPILFAGSELLVVGHYPADGRALRGNVTAVAPDGPRSYPFDFPTATDGPGWLPRLVAYHEIRDLSARMDAEGERPEWVNRVRTLAVDFGFVTDYTSLVLSLPERDRPQEQCWDCDGDVLMAESVPSESADKGSRWSWGRSSADSSSAPVAAPGAGGHYAPTPASSPTEAHAVPAPAMVVAVVLVALVAVVVKRRS